MSVRQAEGGVAPCTDLDASRCIGIRAGLGSGRYTKMRTGVGSGRCTGLGLDLEPEGALRLGLELFQQPETSRANGPTTKT